MNIWPKVDCILKIQRTKGQNCKIPSWFWTCLADDTVAEACITRIMFVIKFTKEMKKVQHL